MAQKLRGPQPWATNRARALRSNQTSAEARLCSKLRNRQRGRFKFVRQAAVGPYFADFLCRECSFIVEIDGTTHGQDGEIAADARRTAELSRLGYRLQRVTNEDVQRNIDGVLEGLLAALMQQA